MERKCYGGRPNAKGVSGGPRSWVEVGSLAANLVSKGTRSVAEVPVSMLKEGINEMRIVAIYNNRWQAMPACLVHLFILFPVCSSYTCAKGADRSGDLRLMRGPPIAAALFLPETWPSFDSCPNSGSS